VSFSTILVLVTLQFGSLAGTLLTYAREQYMDSFLLLLMFIIDTIVVAILLMFPYNQPGKTYDESSVQKKPDQHLTNPPDQN
jgi:hypothetical protein